MSSPGTSPLVGIVMGSDSDWPVMEAAAQALTEFEIPHEVDVVSAHRMPREMIAYGEDAEGDLLKQISTRSNARSLKGDAGNIDKIYHQISAYF